MFLWLLPLCFDKSETEAAKSTGTAENTKEEDGTMEISNTSKTEKAFPVENQAITDVENGVEKQQQSKTLSEEMKQHTREDERKPAQKSWQDLVYELSESKSKDMTEKSPSKIGSMVNKLERGPSNA